MKPLIGVTAGEVENKKWPWSPIIYGQSHTYIDAIIHAGGIPVIIPLTQDDSVTEAIYKKLDGILFSGGNDISPGLYGKQPLETDLDVSDFRDGVEAQLMRLALKDHKPILGICRGAQLLNALCGGTLYQDIAHDLPDAHNHESSTEAQNTTHIAHLLKIAEHSRLAEILGTTPVKTNAHHHQAVKRIGDNLQAVAWAEDGIIEAIEQPGDAFVIGVQSHPESLESAAEPRWQRLFSAFVEASAQTIHSKTESLYELDSVA